MMSTLDYMSCVEYKFQAETEFNAQRAEVCTTGSRLRRNTTPEKFDMDEK